MKWVKSMPERREEWFKKAYLLNFLQLTYVYVCALYFFLFLSLSFFFSRCLISSELERSPMIAIVATHRQADSLKRLMISSLVGRSKRKMKEKYIACVFIRAREHIHIFPVLFKYAYTRFRRLILLTVHPRLSLICLIIIARSKLSHRREIPTLR